MRPPEAVFKMKNIFSSFVKQPSLARSCWVVFHWKQVDDEVSSINVSFSDQKKEKKDFH